MIFVIKSCLLGSSAKNASKSVSPIYPLLPEVGTETKEKKKILEKENYFSKILKNKKNEEGS